ncbi:uncharacterized protein LOC119458164 isoform X2 [Dermacentor silvarum]|uniref:uncharacterized protein LOC119458164 isoform X2 n=1 Tax=Dermacentor silvarum TaxID=543639 RepID=UPI00189ACFF7|nr:uncharacterized protein LOC119458164 isoform X2 [Dermacentor silvarum]XP_049526774.1 uncharacterized protein LOC119458164 isoform X2 [Dermacentor silvarum]
MMVVKPLAAVILMASYAVAIPYYKNCDFSGIDLDGALDKVLGNLPRYHAPDRRGFRRAFAGLETGSLNVTGLDKIRRFGAIHPYCDNGTLLMSVDVIDEGDVVLSLPWRACSGHEGTLNVRTGLSRFTLVFRVVTEESSNNVDNTVLTYEGPLIPVITVDPHIYINGAGREIRTASMILSKLLPAFTEGVWNDYFFIYFRGALREALRDAFE